MKIINGYGPMLLALGYMDGKPGELRQIMKDNPEELFGPPFLRDELGRVCSHFSIPGEMTVVPAGRHDPKNGILLMPSMWQIVHEWNEDKHRYKIVVQDFRILQKGKRVAP